MKNHKSLFSSKLDAIYKKIQELSSEADSLNTSAKSDFNNYHLFKLAAEKYQELVEAYEIYLSMVKPTANTKVLLLLKANMYHEKYDSHASYGEYYSLIEDFKNATTSYDAAEENIQKAVHYISESLKEDLTAEERECAERDFHVWSLDLLLLKAMKIKNESNHAISNNNYALASDKTQEAIDVLQKVCQTISANPQYFSYGEQRRYNGHVAALCANLCTINSMQSEEEYIKAHSDNTFIDAILHSVKSYEYTVNAIKIDNFWSDYKNVRDNIFKSIARSLSISKEIWPIILQRSSSNSLLTEIMSGIDSKYYKKITNTGRTITMNIFRNKVKTKGTVVINNGNDNNTVVQSNTLLSSSDIDQLKNFVEYIKNTPSDTFTSEEYINTIRNLNAIISANTSAEQEKGLKNWNTFKTRLSQSALNFLSLSSDIISVGTFIKNLLGL